MLLYKVIETIEKPELKRKGKIVNTERGEMLDIFLGKTRIIRNKITKKTKIQEAYIIAVKHYSEIDSKFHWNIDKKKEYWTTIK